MSTRLAVVTMFSLLAAGCMPTTSAYLSIPVAAEDGQPRSLVKLRVPLRELESRMSGLDLDTLSFYARDREPIPHRLVDEDDDGRPDAALVAIAVSGNGHGRLVAVCPGPAAAGAVPAAEKDSTVVLRFERASNN